MSAPLDSRISTRVGLRDDGLPYHSFRTLDVLLDDEAIGAIQCKGVCFGIMADPYHMHALWFAFKGPNGRGGKISGPHEGEDAAIAAVLAKHLDGAK